MIKWLRNKGSIYTQLWLWVFGIPVHNTYRGECTPNFDCCGRFKSSFIKRLKKALFQPIEDIIYSYRVKKFDKEYFKGVDVK
jgi:hypothetical protein